MTGWQLLTRLLAMAVPLAVGADLPLRSGLSVGGGLALVLAPLWLPEARRFVGAAPLLATVAACLVSAGLLTAWAAPTHTILVPSVVQTLLALVGVAASVGALLWSRSVLGLSTTALLFGLGMLNGFTSSARFAENPWRFGFQLPVTVIALALCLRAGRLWVDVVVLLPLAAISTIAGGRSFSALLLLTLALVVWQRRPAFRRRSASVLGALVFVGVLAFGTYQALQGAALEGHLGADAQERTALQIQQSGSLILGGRPEVGATAALLMHRPLGFGPGTLPSPTDLRVAKEGMAALGYDPHNGYVERYMFGDGIELHSLLGSFWASYGPAGLLLTAVLVALALRRLGHGLAHRTGSALVYLLALRLLWDVCFSPVTDTSEHLPLVLAAVLMPQAAGARDRSAAGSPGGTPPRAGHRGRPSRGPTGPAAGPAAGQRPRVPSGAPPG